MGDAPISPYAPSPPSALSTKGANLPLLYYGLVVVGTAAIVLVAYNLIVLRWFSYSRPTDRSRGGIAPPRRRLEAGRASGQSLDNPNAHLISSFKYKKEGSSPKDAGVCSEYECAVCLSAFEEGEEVKQLPRCKHSFHAPCIDMWLYSHLDCPLCRSPVDSPPFLNRVGASSTRLQAGNPRPPSRGLLASISVE